VSKSKREQVKRNKIENKKQFDEVAARQNLDKLVKHSIELIENTYSQLDNTQKRQMSSQVSNIILASINELKSKIKDVANEKKN
jgi:hypothetical protein